MTTQTDSDHTAAAGLPAFPQERSAQCPFDPPAAYRDWRQTEGLQRARMWDGSQVWVVTRYEDIRTALGDPRVSADVTRPGFPRISPGSGARRRKEEIVFARMDDPRHAEHRRMLTRFFTVKRAEAMRPDIEKLVHDSLDHMIASGKPADLVSQFALPVPSKVIALLLDIPYEDHAFFQDNSQKLFDLSAPATEVRAAVEALSSYLFEHIDRKGREPGDDLVGLLRRREDRHRGTHP